MYDTLLIDGTDLATVVSCLQSLDGLYQVTSPRTDNVTFPFVDGEDYVDKWYGAPVIDFGIILAGSTQTDFNDGFRVLKQLIQPGKKLTLERRMSFSTGNEQHSAEGEYAGGLSPGVSLLRFGRITLSLKVLNGVWYSGAAITEIVASGAVGLTVQGETRTHRMTITMDPGATITNATTGYELSNTAGAGGSVVIDVLDMTATQDGNDVSGTLMWTGGNYPMRLAPGTNNFSGDGFTVDYFAAYT